MFECQEFVCFLFLSKRLLLRRHEWAKKSPHKGAGNDGFDTKTLMSG